MALSSLLGKKSSLTREELIAKLGEKTYQLEEIFIQRKKLYNECERDS